MTKLNEKYLAGFLDADGSIQIQWSKVDRANTDPTMMRAYPSLQFSQRTDKDAVLHMIQRDYGGVLTVVERNKESYTNVKITGRPAHMILSRIAKHLVIKRHYAEFVLGIAMQIHNREEMTARLKAERKIKSLPLPNFPSRSWMAGYVDGDGCFACSFVGGGKASVQPTLQISCSDYDSEGIELIQKAFGGSISAKGAEKNILTLTIALAPSKAKSIIGHFGKHLITKRSQAEFILGCAEMGNYRDGEIIKAALKQLKAHPHRLSELGPNVSEMLKSVRNFTLKDTYRRYWDKRQSVQASA